jgi:HK97 family phage prohead protease
MSQKPKLRDLTAIEVRRVRTPATVRADAGDDGPGEIRFTGHAAIFESPTWIGPPKWGFQEVIARGAFAKTINESDVRFLINHDPNLILARTTAGTMTLAEDKIGLAVDAQLAATSYGQDLAVSLERGDMSQMSFGFRVVREEWEEIEVEPGVVIERRTLQEVELFDVSSVTYPAYEDTDGGLAAATMARELRDRRLSPDPAGRPARTTTPTATSDGGPGDRGAAPAPAAAATDPTPTTATTATSDGGAGDRGGDPAGHPQTTLTTVPTVTTAGDPGDDGATPDPAGEARATEDDQPLYVLLLAHSAGDHAGTSRAKCPPCTKALTQPPPATSGTAAAA